MIIIINKNEQNKKFMPMLSLANNEEELKKAVKKQLISEILEDPTKLKAYKNISVWKLGETNDDFDIELVEKEKIFNYSEILFEIIDELTKGLEEK